MPAISREQFVGIVKNMEAAGESPESIARFVNEYHSRNSQQPAPALSGDLPEMGAPTPTGREQMQRSMSSTGAATALSNGSEELADIDAPDYDLSSSNSAPRMEIDRNQGKLTGFAKGLGQAGANTAALGFKLRDLAFGTADPEQDPLGKLSRAVGGEGAGQAVSRRGPALRKIPGIGHAAKLGDAIERAADVKGAEEFYQPDPQSPGEQEGANVGEFAGNMLVGAAAGGVVSGAMGTGGGLLQKGGKMLLQELAENAAFTGQALQEGGDAEAAGSAATDAALSMGLRFGGGKALKLGKGLVKRIKQANAPDAAFKPLIEAIGDEKELVRIVDELPDIEDLDNVSIERGARKRRSWSEIQADAPPDPKKPILTNIEEADAAMLQEPETKYDVPFDEYIEHAGRAKNNRRLMSPYDVTGSRATEALDQISELKRTFGQQKQAAMETRQDAIIDMAPVKAKWQGLLADRFRAKIDEAGQVVPLLDGGKIRNGAGLQSITDEIMSTQDEVFAIEADDLASNLRDLLQNPKQSEFKQVSKAVDGATKDVRGELKDILNRTLGEEYAEANRGYAKLSEYEKWLNSRLGQDVGTFVDPETGDMSRVARHGGSLIKSVFSPADRGNKAQFEQIRKLTGIDLVRDATYAKLAMELVGDTRVNDLLRTTANAGGVVKDAVSGNKIGAAGKLLKGSKERLIGKDIERILNFYNKAQGRAEKKAQQSARQRLKDLGGITPGM